jgi:hypothetical protein
MRRLAMAVAFGAPLALAAVAQAGTVDLVTSFTEFEEYGFAFRTQFYQSGATYQDFVRSGSTSRTFGGVSASSYGSFVGSSSHVGPLTSFNWTLDLHVTASVDASEVNGQAFAGIDAFWPSGILEFSVVGDPVRYAGNLDAFGFFYGGVVSGSVLQPGNYRFDFHNHVLETPRVYAGQSSDLSQHYDLVANFVAVPLPSAAEIGLGTLGLLGLVTWRRKRLPTGVTT